MQSRATPDRGMANLSLVVGTLSRPNHKKIRAWRLPRPNRRAVTPEACQSSSAHLRCDGRPGDARRPSAAVSREWKDLCGFNPDDSRTWRRGPLCGRSCLSTTTRIEKFPAIENAGARAKALVIPKKWSGIWDGVENLGACATIFLKAL